MTHTFFPSPFSEMFYFLGQINASSSHNSSRQTASSMVNVSSGNVSHPSGMLNIGPNVSHQTAGSHSIGQNVSQSQHSTSVNISQSISHRMETVPTGYNMRTPDKNYY